jgi:hypothetical protein
LIQLFDPFSLNGHGLFRPLAVFLGDFESGRKLSQEPESDLFDRVLGLRDIELEAVC